MEGLLLKLPPGFLLMLMWYVYLVYGTDLFSWFSTLSLVILTTLYLCYARLQWEIAGGAGRQGLL